jgi:hypothetical protein
MAMEKSVVKTKKSPATGKAKSPEMKKKITEEDIRRRAYEIYNEYGTPQNELDDWLRAEQELSGEEF